MITFQSNTKIRSAERIAGIDRHGQPLRSTVSASHLKEGRLEKRTVRVTNLQGKTSTVDGTLMVDAGLELEEGDKVTLEDESQWEVFSVDESLDLSGEIEFRTYNLTKQRVKT